MNQEDRGLPHRSGPIEVLGSASVSSGAVCMSFHELSYSNKTHPSRSSPAPTPSTQRTACDAERDGRLVDVAVRRCGGAAVRRCRASARTYGWDTLEPFITIKLGGRRYFAMSGHAGRLCVRGFLRLGLRDELCLSKTTMEMGVRRVRKDERGRLWRRPHIFKTR